MTHKTSLKQTTALRRIGMWATIWWAVSCFYPFLLVVHARGIYVDTATSHTGGWWADWSWAIGQAWRAHSYLGWLLGLVLLVWLVGGVLWLRAVRAAGNTYAAAFKDLFLTIRK